MPRNQLLDMLFSLYREQLRWSAKDLRTRTEQPEVYLKEVLAQIANLHRSGEFNGQYELKPNFKDSVRACSVCKNGMLIIPQVKAESDEYSGAAGELMKVKSVDDDELDEKEEVEDMEEVS